MTDGDYHEEIQRLREEVEALTADNAALVRVLRLNAECAQGCMECGMTRLHLSECVTGGMLAQPHPGTALLEEHRKALEEARYADDNAKAFTQAFCETAEAAVQNASYSLTAKGGQHVSFHGDFAHVPPSAIARLRWWAACGRAALNGEASALLVRAKNEGLEKAALRVETNPPGHNRNDHAETIRALREAE